MLSERGFSWSYPYAIEPAGKQVKPGIAEPVLRHRRSPSITNSMIITVNRGFWSIFDSECRSKNKCVVARIDQSRQYENWLTPDPEGDMN
jgi:hypothetical protein